MEFNKNQENIYELLPCPNNNNHEVYLIGEEFESEKRKVYSVKCKGCNLSGPSDYDQKEAISKWNLICGYKSN